MFFSPCGATDGTLECGTMNYYKNGLYYECQHPNTAGPGHRRRDAARSTGIFTLLHPRALEASRSAAGPLVIWLDPRNVYSTAGQHAQLRSTAVLAHIDVDRAAEPEGRRTSAAQRCSRWASATPILG